MENMRKSLYPERASIGVEEKITQLKDFEQGASETLSLTSEERERMLETECNFGNKLEEIFSITPKSLSIYSEYFLTPEGREDYALVTGLELPEDVMTSHDVLGVFYNNKEILDINKSALSDMAGRSRNWNEEEIYNQLHQAIFQNKSIDDVPIPASRPTSILFSPEDNLAKSTQLLDFKQSLKELRTKIKGSDNVIGDYEEASLGILDLYQRRVNELIADIRLSGIPLRKKQELLGNGALSESELELLKFTPTINNADRVAAMYDKFKYGASIESNEEGYREQIPEGLAKLADIIEAEYYDSILNRDEKNS